MMKVMSGAAQLNTKFRQLFTPITNPLQKTATEEQLDILNNVMAQVVPQVTLESTDTLNPTQSTVNFKEIEAAQSVDITPVEAAAGLQAVEQEPRPEMPAEVEQYLAEVKANPQQAPEKIVIADGTMPTSVAQPPIKKPVIVLPISQTEESEGKKRPITDSFRWLVEWSQKIIKMFTGEVIYRSEPVTK